MSPLRPRTASRETDTGREEDIRDKDGDKNYLGMVHQLLETLIPSLDGGMISQNWMEQISESELYGWRVHITRMKGYVIQMG